MKPPPTSIGQSIGFSSSNSPNTLARPANTVSSTAPTLWTMLPVRMPQPLQPDRHRQRDADLQRDFGQARALRDRRRRR